MVETFSEVTLQPEQLSSLPRAAMAVIDTTLYDQLVHFVHQYSVVVDLYFQSRMSATLFELRAARFTVDSFTIAVGGVRVKGDLAAAITEAVGLRCPSKNDRVQARWHIDLSSALPFLLVHAHVVHSMCHTARINSHVL